MKGMLNFGSYRHRKPTLHETQIEFCHVYQKAFHQEVPRKSVRIVIKWNTSAPGLC